MAATGYNRMVLERRKAFISAVDNSKGEAAREKLRRLRPEDNFLFGGKVMALCKELRDGQLISGQVTLKFKSFLIYISACFSSTTTRRFRTSTPEVVLLVRDRLGTRSRSRRTRSSNPRANCSTRS